MRSLQMRGGLRMGVLRGGIIRVGDAIQLLEGNR
jgi:MOSC domain-containing protein YiiM